MAKTVFSRAAFFGRAVSVADTVGSLGHIGGTQMLLAASSASVFGGLQTLPVVIPLCALGIVWFLWASDKKGVLLRAEMKSRHVRERAELRSRPVVLRKEFKSERVHLSRIVGSDRVIRDMTLVDCEVVGPAVLCGAGGAIWLDEPRYSADHADEVFVPMANMSRRPKGMVGVAGVMFKRCLFVNVTFAIPQNMIDDLVRDITPPTPHTPSAPPPESIPARPGK